MAKPEKEKPFRGITPRGVFKFPALVKADYGTDEFPKPDGEFKTQVILSREAAQPLIDKLQPIFDKAIEEGEAEFAKLKVEQRKKLKELKVNEFFIEEYDQETEEPTGNVIFRFKMKAGGVREVRGKKEEWSQRPALFDAKGKPLKGVKAIYGGSEGKVSFTARPYFVAGQGAAGLSLLLEAAQILELRAGGERSASGYGFGVEDGFEYEAEEETFPTEESADSTAGAEEGDF